MATWLRETSSDCTSAEVVGFTEHYWLDNPEQLSHDMRVHTHPRRVLPAMNPLNLTSHVLRQILGGGRV